MKQLFLFFLLGLFCGCGSSKVDVAALPSTSFVATNGPIPMATIHMLTESDKDRLKRFYPRTLEQLNGLKPLMMQDIINMTRSGIEDDVIIHEIHATRSTFYLTPANESSLEQAGVSFRIIEEMKSTTTSSY